MSFCMLDIMSVVKFEHLKFQSKRNSQLFHKFQNLDLPVAVSLPHFYNSDPSLVNEVEGLHPEKEKHESVVAMEPVS